MTYRYRKLTPLVALVALALVILTGCTGGTKSELTLLPSDQLPAEVQAAPAAVRQAYQFAAANPEVMEHIPCYCGCGSIGHKSNYACYVSGVDGDGAPIFDNHALGCSICVDITQDTMRLMQDGKSVEEIKTYVDATYAKYGPSNMP